MKKFLFLVLLFPLVSCATPKEQKASQKNIQYSQFPDSVLAGQTIMVAGGELGRPESQIAELISKGMVGGVIFLKIDKLDLQRSLRRFDSIAESNGLPPLIYATDAEPGMFNSKIKGAANTPYNSQIKTAFDSRVAATTISEELHTLGLRWNFAPVCDLPGNNSAIGRRSFPGGPPQVSQFAWAFTKETQLRGIAATAKHFPGHGRVSGDTHEGLVLIDGDLVELDAFQYLIDSGVSSVMIGHIAVTNNEYSTDSLPASCSSRIITDLLKNKMGFQGVVITDAMNMGAIRKVKDPEIKALEAGAHVILMPRNPFSVYAAIEERMKEDPAFAERIREAGKKVLELKETFPK